MQHWLKSCQKNKLLHQNLTSRRSFTNGVGAGKFKVFPKILFIYSKNIIHIFKKYHSYIQNLVHIQIQKFTYHNMAKYGNFVVWFATTDWNKVKFLDKVLVFHNISKNNIYIYSFKQ